MKRSKAVTRAHNRVWALLATVAARKAVQRAEFDDASGAERLANTALRWMDKAGAYATEWYYQHPKA